MNTERRRAKVPSVQCTGTRDRHEVQATSRAGVKVSLPFFVLFLLYSRTFPVIAQAEVKTILKSSGERYKNIRESGGDLSGTASDDRTSKKVRSTNLNKKNRDEKK